MVAGKLTVVQVVPEMDEGGVEGETLDFAIYLVKKGQSLHCHIRWRQARGAA